MKIDILDLIDFEKVDTLLEGFNKSTGFITAILDLEGNVLSQSRWSQICTEFHRIHPETAKKCTLSDTELAGKLDKGKKYHFQKCLNGLVDVAFPIVINGEHIANLFSGQFFLEKPDQDFFKKRAIKYEFDEEKYLKALEIVPVVSKEKVLSTMEFLLNMIQLISEMTLQKQEQTEINKTIQESEEKFKLSFHSNPVPQVIVTLDGTFVESNQAFSKLTGFSNEEIIGKTSVELKLFSAKERNKLAEHAIASGGTIFHALTKLRVRDSGLRDILYSVEPIILKGITHRLVMGIDVTEKEKAEAEIRFQAKLLNAVEQSVIVTKPNGEIIYWNPFAEKTYGWTADEAVGKNIVNVTVPRLSIEKSTEIMQILNAGKSWSGEFDVRHRNGTIFSSFVSDTPVYDDRGELAAIIGISTDITEQKEAEKRLSKSNFELSSYNSLFNKLSTNISHELVVNTAIEEIRTILKPDMVLIFERRDKELVLLGAGPENSKYLHESTPKHAYGECLCGFAVASGKPTYSMNIHKDARCTWDECKVAGINSFAAIPLRGETGIIGILGIASGTIRDFAEQSTFIETIAAVVAINLNKSLLDKKLREKAEALQAEIIERKKIENSLRESQKFNETLLNTSPDIIYIYDLVENQNVYSNEGIYRILGYSIEEIQEMGNELISSLMHKEDFDFHSNKTFPLYQTMKDGELIEHEYRMRHKHGGWRWLHSKESIFKRNPDHSPKQLFGIISDVTDSKEVQQKLLEEKTKAQQYLEIAEVILLSIDSNGIVQLINPKGCEVLGYTEEEIIGQAWYDNFVPERIRKSIKEVVKKIFSGEIESAKYYENEVLTKSGEEKLIAWNNSVLKDEKGNIIGTLSSGEDITERKKAEVELEKYRKHLEELVNERTKDLEIKISEIERMNKLFVGRELRMKELKGIIKDLEKKLKMT